MMKQTSLALSALSLVACTAGTAGTAEEEQDADPTAVVVAPLSPSSQEEAIKARPCRSDSFFVEVPLRLSAPQWTTADIYSAVDGALDPLANASKFPWFCGDGATTCPRGGVEVRVVSLLEPRDWPPARADGDRRFFRVRFVDEDTGELLSVRPGAHCKVVDELRTALGSLTPADQIHIGRECDASGLGVEAVATHEMRTWHLDRLGLPDTLATVPPDPLQPVVDVALIDSGVDPAVGAAIGLASSSDFTDGGTALHPHGTAMAALVRQAAPNAAIHSLRVFDEDGFAQSGALARAIDAALVPVDRPLVINLSLGWPAQLSQAAELTGEDSCSTYEDPVGESVRYLLYVAQQVDRPVFVAAAAGNQPGPVHPSTFPPIPPDAPAGDCSAQALPGTPWFLPAWWQHLDSCQVGEPGVYRLALGIGAVDDQDRPSGVAIPDAEPALVAPGQHVYADHPAGTLPSPDPICPNQGDPPPSEPAAVTLPMALTGTSVGAALTSGAAARAQATRLAQGDPPLQRDVLARLLYLSGQSVCDEPSGGARLTPAGAPVRRLNVERLDYLLSAAACTQLIACAEAAAGTDPIGASLLHDCRDELEDCDLETLDLLDEIVVDCAVHTAVAWPADYAATAPVCAEWDVEGPFIDAATCGPAGCPYTDMPYRTLLGSLGPSPDVPVCPDCELSTESASEGHLLLELNSKLDAGTLISKPFLVIQGYAGNPPVTPVTHYIDLVPYAAPSEWTPGATLRLTVPLSGIPQGFDWSTAEAVLVTTVTEADGSSGNDRSPLHVVF